MTPARGRLPDCRQDGGADQFCRGPDEADQDQVRHLLLRINQRLLQGWLLSFQFW
jgi:hypothetical protein